MLYNQLGSYDQARGYLVTALQMPDVTPVLRQKIEELLDLVGRKLQRRPASAIRPTRAAAPERRPSLPPAQRSTAPSWRIPNRFGAVGVDYVHDFETRTGETFEASVIG